MKLWAFIGGFCGGLVAAIGATMGVNWVVFPPVEPRPSEQPTGLSLLIENHSLQMENLKLQRENLLMVLKLDELRREAIRPHPRVELIPAPGEPLPTK